MDPDKPVVESLGDLVITPPRWSLVAKPRSAIGEGIFDRSDDLERRESDVLLCRPVATGPPPHISEYSAMELSATTSRSC
jgi:hypothetical protein